MRIIHVGLDDFGFGWCKAVYDRDDLELIAAVDRNEETQKRLNMFNVPCFTDLADVLESENLFLSLTQRRLVPI